MRPDFSDDSPADDYNGYFTKTRVQKKKDIRRVFKFNPINLRIKYNILCLTSKRFNTRAMKIKATLD